MRLVCLASLLTICASAAQTLPDPAPAAPPAPADEFRVYTEHPRLLLRPQRLRLLKRERERQSMRWKQFEALISGGAALPEPGFGWALFHAIAGDAKTGKLAVDWALGPGTDLRQLAIVFDWCQDVLTEGQSAALAARIQKGIAQSDSPETASQRSRALAAIAIADLNMDFAEKVLRDVVEQWWRRDTAPALEKGRDLDAGAELYSLFEMLHAVRDNLTLDMRLSAPGYFKDLPSYQIAGNYPNPFPAAENEYWIPVYKGAGQPDPNRAALARAAGLSTVAFDTNALQNQFLQGWLIQDRFMLRGALGAPYEFLWANPYQPGLSFEHVPLLFHDARSGTLFLRSNWDENAVWFGLYQGEAQLFRDGKITVLTSSANQNARRAAKPELIEIGGASVMLAREGLRFRTAAEHIFVFGWKPRIRYEVEVDDEELLEIETDAAGTMALDFPEARDAGVRIAGFARGIAGVPITGGSLGHH